VNVCAACVDMVCACSGKMYLDRHDETKEL
jgi:hypothetical protein